LRKGIAYALTALAILLVMSASTAPTLAADYTKPGAVVGTNALYDYSLSPSNVTINAIRIRVTAVSGSVLTLNKTEYNPGGSVNNTHTGSFNVSTYQYGVWRFVAANISSGEAPYPGEIAWRFNQTVSNYHIAGRYWTANYINQTVSGVNLVAYIDKPTGILLYWRYRSWNGLMENYTLTSYTVESGGFPLELGLFAGGAAALIVIIAVVIYLRRR